MTFTTWGQVATHTTTVEASPAPTASILTVAAVGNLRVGHILFIEVDASPEQTAITAINGDELTVSPPLSDAPDVPGSVECFSEPVTNEKLELSSLWAISSTSALSANPDAGMRDGTRVQVTSGGGIYRLDQSSSATADGYLVLATHSGVGRWLFEIGGNLWQTITASQSAANGGRYIPNNSSRVAVTLPASPAVGAEIELVNRGTGGWELKPVVGQTIREGSTEYVFGQQAQSNATYSAIRLLCTATNQFTIINLQGSITWAASGAGYIMGGGNAGAHSTIYKLSFSTEATSTLGATLNTTRQQVWGCNSATKGYTGGGTNGTNHTSIEDLDFAAETSVPIAATLANNVRDVGAASSTLAGYTLGGYNANAGTYLTSLAKLTFASETTSTPAAVLAAARLNHSPVSSSTAAYRLGGSNNIGTAQTDCEKLTFASDGISAIGATLATGRKQYAGVQSGSTAGYAIGGFSGASAAQTLITKFAFGAESVSTLAATLNTGRDDNVGVNSVAKGFSVGGNGPSAVIEDLNFATESSDAISATLPAARQYPAGVSSLAG
ncbi:MAG: hypothetical protein CVV27_02410 [Candidatus Melainabacteria bacterium HGW-Melainabacteria-1]|nr:MAG: hypothetical protein CVV27_02410 [Candidatus Melainabacteria bacterium HGW-Melainabacteria-1]